MSYLLILQGEIDCSVEGLESIHWTLQKRADQIDRGEELPWVWHTEGMIMLWSEYFIFELIN